MKKRYLIIIALFFVFIATNSTLKAQDPPHNMYISLKYSMDDCATTGAVKAWCESTWQPTVHIYSVTYTLYNNGWKVDEISTEEDDPVTFNNVAVGDFYEIKTTGLLYFYDNFNQINYVKADDYTSFFSVTANPLTANAKINGQTSPLTICEGSDIVLDISNSSSCAEHFAIAIQHMNAAGNTILDYYNVSFDGSPTTLGNLNIRDFCSNGGFALTTGNYYRVAVSVYNDDWEVNSCFRSFFLPPMNHYINQTLAEDTYLYEATNSIIFQPGAYFNADNSSKNLKGKIISCSSYGSSETLSDGDNKEQTNENLNTSSTINFDNSSVKQIKNGTLPNVIDFKVIPNPNSGVFKINFGNSITKMNIKIFNSMGMMVYSKEGIESNEEIDLSIHPKGIYYISLGDGESVKTTKLIIN
jgi:hypothetical protein